MSSIFVLVSKILCLIHSRCSLHLLNGEISYVELHKTFSVFNHCELLSFLFLFFHFPIDSIYTSHIYHFYQAVSKI